MATGSEITLNALPLRRRPWATLLAEAEEIGDIGRWRGGLKVIPYGCDGLTSSSLAFCIDDDDESFDDDADSGECPTFSAFHIHATDSVSTLDYDSAFVEGRVSDRFSAYVSASLAQRVIEGDGAGLEPSFVDDAVVITTGDGVELAYLLPQLEQHLAEKLHGAQGMIWVSPAALSMLSDHLQFVDGSWFTASGHIVVADAGHADQAPEGETSGAGQGWAYASGIVAYKLGEPDFQEPTAVEYLDRSRNEIHARHIAEAVVAFEVCPLGAAKFRYTESTPVEGS